MSCGGAGTPRPSRRRCSGAAIERGGGSPQSRSSTCRSSNWSATQRAARGARLAYRRGGRPHRPARSTRMFAGVCCRHMMIISACGADVPVRCPLFAQVGGRGVLYVAPHHAIMSYLVKAKLVSSATGSLELRLGRDGPRTSIWSETTKTRPFADFVQIRDFPPL